MGVRPLWPRAVNAFGQHMQVGMRTVEWVNGIREDTRFRVNAAFSESHPQPPCMDPGCTL